MRRIAEIDTPAAGPSMAFLMMLYPEAEDVAAGFS
jgi:hypothetical protein